MLSFYRKTGNRQQGGTGSISPVFYPLCRRNVFRKRQREYSITNRKCVNRGIAGGTGWILRLKFSYIHIVSKRNTQCTTAKCQMRKIISNRQSRRSLSVRTGKQNVRKSRKKIKFTGRCSKHIVLQNFPRLIRMEKSVIITAAWKVSEWLAASLEMRCIERCCGFDSRAFRSVNTGFPGLHGFL